MSQPRTWVSALARETGALLMQYFNSASLKKFAKGKNDIVTEADLAAEQHIIEAISVHFPNDAIHAEEKRKDPIEGADRIWVIDPLDGTFNFSNGWPIFGVAIALLEQGVPTLGAVYLPAMQQLFSADASGAYFNDALFSTAKSTSTLVTLHHGFHISPSCPGGTTLARIERLLGQTARLRSMGAMAPEVCYSAFYPNTVALFSNFGPWDIAAAGFIAQQAGNHLTTFGGTPWSVTADTCLSAPPLIHADLLHIVGDSPHV